MSASGSETASRSLLATVLGLAVPISAQHVLSSSFQLVDVVMVSELGEVAVGAASLSSRVFMVLALVLGALGSGISIFCVQAWAQKDAATVRGAVGAGLWISAAVILPVTLIAVAFPRAVMQLLSPDPLLVEAGASVLRLTALTYPLAAITFVAAAGSRAVGGVKLPLVASFAGIALNTALNYGLIFGRLGMPRWGLEGAAIATSLSKAVECAILVGGLHLLRSVAAPGLGLLRQASGMLRRVLHTAWPLVVNEFVWAFGLFTYFLVYARMGTSSLATMGQLAPIEYICIDVFVGVGTATAIVVGSELGLGRLDVARSHARRLLLLGPLSAVVFGAGVYLLDQRVLAVFGATASDEARIVLYVIAGALGLRVFNLIAAVGVLRSGGDTRFLLVSTVGSMWLVGIPLAALAGLYFKLPVYVVYSAALADEVVKAVLFGRRIASGKWLRSLVGGPPAAAADSEAQARMPVSASSGA